MQDIDDYEDAKFEILIVPAWELAHGDLGIVFGEAFVLN